MKSTTFQQKSILTIKIAVCAFVMGLLGWLSFAAPPPAEAAPGDVVLSVTVAAQYPEVNPTAPAVVGQTVDIGGYTINIKPGPVEGVYLIRGGSSVKLVGNVEVANDGTLSGSVNMPVGLPSGSYTLVVVGETMHNPDGIFPAMVEGEVRVDFVSDGPTVDCVHNVGTLCDLPPNDGKNAFGDNDKDTEIIIDGENFSDGEGDTTVTVGGEECKIVFVSADGKQIICIVKKNPNKTGPQDVTVCVHRLCSTKIGGFTFIGRVPNVPNTGLFRIGDTVVTLKDVMWWGGLAVILAATAMLIMIVKTPVKARYSVKSGASKKRNYRKQKVSFSSKKKSPKRR